MYSILPPNAFTLPGTMKRKSVSRDSFTLAGDGGFEHGCTANSQKQLTEMKTLKMIVHISRLHQTDYCHQQSGMFVMSPPLPVLRPSDTGESEPVTGRFKRAKPAKLDGFATRSSRMFPSEFLGKGKRPNQILASSLPIRDALVCRFP
jgi:hypothetical protein